MDIDPKWTLEKPDRAFGEIAEPALVNPTFVCTITRRCSAVGSSAPSGEPLIEAGTRLLAVWDAVPRSPELIDPVFTAERLTAQSLLGCCR